MDKSYRVIQRPMRDPLGEGVVWSAREKAVYRVDILWQALQRRKRACSPGVGR